MAAARTNVGRRWGSFPARGVVVEIFPRAVAGKAGGVNKGYEGKGDFAALHKISALWLKGTFTW